MKKIEDFKTDYKVKKYEQDWTIRALKAIGHNNFWMTSSARYRVNLENKILTLNEWVDGMEEDVAIVIKVVESIGWNVNMKVEEVNTDTGILFTEDPDTNLEKLEELRSQVGG